MSPTELTKVRDALAGALSVDEVNQLGRDTGQAIRLRTVTPHRLFLAIVSALACGQVESLADLLRAFNHQHEVQAKNYLKRTTITLLFFLSHGFTTM